MNIGIKRSLGAVAVTGGIVLAGAAAAQADDLGPISTSNESSSSSEGSASAPVTVGGLSVGTSSERASSSTSETTVTDGDRSTTERTESESSSSSSTSFGTEAITLDPQAALERSDARESSRLGRDLADDSSSSSTSGAASLPIDFGGFVFERDSASASSDAVRSEVVDGDRSSVTENTSVREDESSTSFGGGGFALNPNAGFDTEQARESSRLGGSSLESSNRSQSSTTGGLPIAFDGLTGSNESSRLRADRSESTVTDGDRSATEIVQSGSLVERGFEATGGAFAADPAFGFGTERVSDTDRLGSLNESTSSTDADGFVGGPFSGGAFDVSTWSSTIAEDLRVSKAVDGDRSTETVTTDRSERNDAQDFGFDGFDGNPMGSFDTRTDRISDIFRR